MCHRKVIIMGYSRTRSRTDFNDIYTFKVGTVGAGWYAYELIITGPREGKPSGEPDDSYTFSDTSLPVSMSGSGVSTYYAGGRYWYNESQLFDRTKSYESEFWAILAPNIPGRIESKLGSTSAPFVGRSGGMTMTDVVTPEYKAISAQGGVVCSPLTSSQFYRASEVKFSETGFTVQLFWADIGRVKLMSGTPEEHYVSRHRLQVYINPGSREVVGIPESVFSTLEGMFDYSHIEPTDAINTAFGNVYKAEADLALFVAEFNKTVGLIGLTAARIAKLVKSIKSGRFLESVPEAYKRFRSQSGSTQLATSSNAFLDIWMEMRYAWRPLLLDAQAAIKYLSSSEVAPRRTFRGFDQEQETDSFDITITSGAYSYHFVGIKTSDKVVRAGCLSQIDPGMALRRDLGLLNPAGLAWELIPYSFVVDWFVNVSALLAKTNPKAGIEVLSSWATKISDVSLSGTCTITNLSSSESRSVTFVTRRLDRHRMVDVSPTYINLHVNLDVAKLVDAVALLRRFKH